MKTKLPAIATLFVLWAAPAASEGAGDPRFFGTYCGETTMRFCARVGLVFKRTRCKNVEVRDIEARLGHLATAGGGLVTGEGDARVKGRKASFVLAGAVTAPGRLRGSITVSGQGTQLAVGRLSADGLALTLHGFNRSFTLRKDRCGNTPPAVAFAHLPVSPVQWGASDFVSATVTDAEDTDFPPERLVWTRDGGLPLDKWPLGTATPTSSLSPGTYTISFTATDSGGLSSTIDTQLTVANELPDAPVIYRPRAGDPLLAGCPTIFRGQAYDREDGFLSGSSLGWRSSRDGELGSGAELVAALTTAGSHVVTLTATDSGGSSRAAVANVVVQPQATGCPPRARIVLPDPQQGYYVPWIGGKKITFRGLAVDPDGPAGLQTQWTITQGGTYFTGATGVSVFETTALSAGGSSREYLAVFSATDGDGHTSSDEVTILVFSKPVL